MQLVGFVMSVVLMGIVSAQPAGVQRPGDTGPFHPGVLRAQVQIFDGKYSGGASSGSTQCWNGAYAITVMGGKISGEASFAGSSGSATSDVSGTVAADGAATITLTKRVPYGRSSTFTGKFADGGFTGDDQGVTCKYAVKLTRN